MGTKPCLSGEHRYSETPPESSCSTDYFGARVFRVFQKTGLFHQAEAKPNKQNLTQHYYEAVAKADVETCKLIQETLVAEFERLCNKVAEEKGPEGEIQFVDGLIGCHNFYRRIILDLCERVGPEKAQFVKECAVVVLIKGLKLESRFKLKD